MLLKKGTIPYSIYCDLLPTGSTPGILYKLPKVHKTNIPVRAILSTVGAYNYKLARNYPSGIFHDLDGVVYFVSFV